MAPKPHHKPTLTILPDESALFLAQRERLLADSIEVGEARMSWGDFIQSCLAGSLPQARMLPEPERYAHMLALMNGAKGDLKDHPWSRLPERDRVHACLRRADALARWGVGPAVRDKILGALSGPQRFCFDMAFRFLSLKHRQGWMVSSALGGKGCWRVKTNSRDIRCNYPRKKKAGPIGPAFGMHDCSVPVSMRR